MNGRAALEVSAQHECIVVQQGGQAVLTASHCLWGTWGCGWNSLSNGQSLGLAQEQEPTPGLQSSSLQQ